MGLFGGLRDNETLRIRLNNFTGNVEFELSTQHKSGLWRIVKPLSCDRFRNMDKNVVSRGIIELLTFMRHASMMKNIKKL
jgi:hypothetical protein